MSEKMGPVALEGESGKALFGKGVDGKEYSERVSAEIDAEVKRLIDDGMNKAKDLLTEHRKVLDVIAKRLIEIENIERDEYEQILIANGIEVKSNKDIDNQK